MFNIKVLCKEETEKILDMSDVISVVEAAYSQKADKNATIFDWVFHEFNPGIADMDIKSGWLKNNGLYGMKLVSFFSENKKKNLPEIIGVIMVFDDKTGVPIGLLDGSHITGMRTGAAGAIGAKYLAKKKSETLLMVGTGHIAKFEIGATLIAVPSVNKVIIYDPRSEESAIRLASNLKNILIDEFKIDRDIEVVVDKKLEESVKMSDIIITATPSREPMIKRNWVKPGTHFSCIGADMPGKVEIDPKILCEARVFVDDLNQCSNIGEIETAIKEGILKQEDVAGEIGDIINGKVPGRENDQQITVFDATGTALLDIITAQLALEKAKQKNVGVNVNL
jgi:ornithine cyclodeaminase/alanine dehydrogenase